MAALTGNYLYNYTLNRYGMQFSGNIPIAWWNRFIEDSLISELESLFRNDYQNQQQKDFLGIFVTTNYRITNIGNNSINTAPISIVQLQNHGGNSWSAVTNIPFAPQNTNGQIDIQGAVGTVGTYPNGQFVVTGFAATVKGTLVVTFTAVGFTGTTANYTVNSGVFSLQNTGNIIPNQIVDYIHLLGIKCKFTKPIYGTPAVLSSNGATPDIITLNFFNNFRSSSLNNLVQVTMSGWLTDTACNGTFYIKKVSDLTFGLYSDVNLQNAVAGNGTGEVNNSILLGLTYYNYATPYLSTEKNSSNPTWDKPGYEIIGNRINIYPMNIINGAITTQCTEVTVDYLGKPKLPYIYSPQNDSYYGLYIDGGDNIFDLTLIYNEKFLLNLIDMNIDKAAVMYRDEVLQKMNNPQQ